LKIDYPVVYGRCFRIIEPQSTTAQNKTEKSRFVYVILLLFKVETTLIKLSFPVNKMFAFFTKCTISEMCAVLELTSKRLARNTITSYRATNCRFTEKLHRFWLFG